MLCFAALLPSIDRETSQGGKPNSGGLPSPYFQHFRLSDCMHSILFNLTGSKPCQCVLSIYCSVLLGAYVGRACMSITPSFTHQAIQARVCRYTTNCCVRGLRCHVVLVSQRCEELDLERIDALIQAHRAKACRGMLILLQRASERSSEQSRICSQC